MSRNTRSKKQPDMAETHAMLFHALGAENRLRILQLLARDTLCVNALSRRTGISAGAVSQHLRLLRTSGLVRSERRGYFIHYRLAPGAARLLRSALNAVFSPKKETPLCAAKTAWVRGGNRPAEVTAAGRAGSRHRLSARN